MTLLIIFIFGLCFGSFLNVLIDRIPKDEGFLKGRSYCDHCKKILQWLDLIPVFSYVLLKGKCRYCKVPISMQYPAIEIFTGIMFVLTFVFAINRNYELGIMNYDSLFIILYSLFITSSLIVILFTDLKYGIIPDKILFPAILITFPYLFLIPNSLFLIHLLSGLGAFAFFLALFLGTKGRGMGFGDVKLAFLMGFLLGFPGIIIALYIAFLTGAILSSTLILWKKKRLKSTIAFGPFLIIGTFLGLFWGDYLLQKALLLLGFPQ